MFHSLSACFCNEKVNSGRQMELDVAKGFAIIFMVLCHSFEVLSQWTSPALELWLDSILGGPFSAVVFMFCMGVGLCYSKRSDPAAYFSRGRHLLLLGFVLEILRDGVPLLIYAWDENLFDSADGFRIFLYYAADCIDVDILQFTGLFFLVFAFLKKFGFRQKKLLAVAVIFSLMGSILRNRSTGSFWFDILTGYLWRSHHASYFPLLNWFLIPIIGLSFGALWVHCKDKKSFYAFVTPIALIITAFYVIFYPFEMGIFNHNTYYGIDLIGVIFASILAIGFIGVCYFIAHRIPRFAGILSWMSSKITSIYCVHWVTISLINTVFYFLNIQLPDPMIVPSGIVILLLSCTIVHFYTKIKSTAKH